MTLRDILARAATGALVVAAGLVPGLARVADAAPAAQSAVGVELGDYYFAPKAITTAAGSVTFRLNNVGDKTHNLIVSGNGVFAASSNVDSGARGGFTADLAPGTYQLLCDVGDHTDRGMVGTLVVTGAAAPEPAPAAPTPAEPAPAEPAPAAETATTESAPVEAGA